MVPFLTILLGLASLVIWPSVDLIVSGWFYTPGQGFLYADLPFFLVLHATAYYGSRVVGMVLAVLALIAALKRRPILAISGKNWLFLFLALMLGPVLLANVIFKDNWGRARPREVTEFGGPSQFSPAWIPEAMPHKNGSFVAGDAAFGFFLPSFAYVLPKKKSLKKKSLLPRSFFWGGTGLGILFGVSRIMMGAHFLSDVLFAAFFMYFLSAALYAGMFGRRETTTHWSNWFFVEQKLPSRRS